MKSVNVCVLSGNLTRDPEEKTFNSGAKVVKFSLAVTNRRGKDKEEVFFVDFESWEERNSDFLMKYVKKGSNVLVTGELKEDSWEDKDGEKRKKLCFRTHNVVFMDSVSKKEDKPAQENKSVKNKEVDDEVDVPF